MKIYCYHIAPIDYWFGALTKAQLDAAIDQNYAPNERQSVRRNVAALEEKSQAAFRKIEWEGDIREGPFFFAVPGDGQMRLGYALKQDNNGNCFVASPVELSGENMTIFDRISVE